MRLIAGLAVTLAAACGGGSDDPMIDAPPGNIDAAQNVVALATCPATVDAMMTTNASAFSPTSVTVPPGGVVKLMATSGHQIGPNTLGTTDPALTVSQGATKCFKMNTANAYGIMCTFHGFAGTITVQ